MSMTTAHSQIPAMAFPAAALIAVVAAGLFIAVALIRAASGMPACCPHPDLTPEEGTDG